MNEVYEKPLLTVKEAANHYHIGINRLSEALKNPDCPFVLRCGKKKLVKKKEFDEYLSSNSAI